MPFGWLTPSGSAGALVEAKALPGLLPIPRRGGRFYREAAFEPPRDSWRLQLLRGWSHEQASEIFRGSTGPGGADGAGAPGRSRFAVGGDHLDCRKDRVHSHVAVSWLAV